MISRKSLQQSWYILPRLFHQQKNYSQKSEASKTALYDLHNKYGGKLINFGGFSLPVHYKDQSLIESHLYTRSFGSIFDVSHMLQTHVYGKDAVAFMESLCPADIKGATGGTSILTIFTNEQGNILDDLIVTKVRNDYLYVVSNAAMRTQDQGIMEAGANKYKSNGKDVALEFLTPDDQSLIAVQGPEAAAILSKLLPSATNLANVKFMRSFCDEVAGVPKCRVTRCGYTGEDGFEISVPSNKIDHVTEALLKKSLNGKRLKLAGLGARDTLRLEAGLCLYGSDIDSKTSPVEASLTWLVSKRRREEKNFPGAEVIVNQIPNKVTRSRVGFQMASNGRVPSARMGVEIIKNNCQVGHITSGSPSPCLGKNIAMGYIESSLKSPGTLVQLKIRDKLYDAEVVRMPFVPSKYYL